MKKDKVRGQDIVELVAYDMGFENKSDLFNISEWYGFKTKENKNLRAKLIPVKDKNNNFNAYKWKKNDINLKEVDVYCIVQTHNKFTVIKIEDFKGDKFVLNDDNLTVTAGIEDTNFIRREFEFDDRIYKIQEVNETIYGIRQRIDDDSKIDVVAIRKLFEQNKEEQCSYCGVKQEQIDLLGVCRSPKVESL